VKWKSLLFGFAIGIAVGVAAQPSAPIYPTTVGRSLERDAIDDGYSRLIVRLYGNLYDTLITPPTGDESRATASFDHGLAMARKARIIAINSVNK